MLRAGTGSCAVLQGCLWDGQCLHQLLLKPPRSQLVLYSLTVALALQRLPGGQA